LPGRPGGEASGHLGRPRIPDANMRRVCVAADDLVTMYRPAGACSRRIHFRSGRTQTDLSDRLRRPVGDA
jgi:hypothetical protein